MSNIVNFDPAKAVAERNADIPQRLAKGDGGGDDPGMEARVAKLEATAEYIQRDVAEIKADLKATNEAVRKFGDDVNSEFKAARSEMRADFRLLFGAIITVALGLAGLMAKGFGWF